MSTPSTKISSEQSELDMGSPVRSAEKSTLFRSLLMRVAYVAQDRPDLAEATKVLEAGARSEGQATGHSGVQASGAPA